ncbi:hypothetical protein [Shewanella sp. TC10]|uniref:hypothetical protein n=1 Tax=Shewanella sp. TC10 TaxID=1419739 RepID=UPI00129DCE82|nr:hypothetical protein [Shewanella sp. TC10]
MKLIKKITNWITLFVSVLSMLSPVYAKSEQDKYEDLRDGFFYKAYGKLSRETIRSISDTYNKQLKQDGDNSLSRAEIHSLLGLIWSMGLDNDYAIADSQLSLNKADEPKDRYIAISALSLAFYNKGWVNLARKQSALLQEGEFDGFADKFKHEELAANLIVGSLAVREGNILVAQDTFGKIAESTDKPWISSLATAAAITMSGSTTNVTSRFSSILTDPTLTGLEKEKIEDIAGVVRRDSQTDLTIELTKKEKTAMTQQVTNLLFESIEHQGKATTQALIVELKRYADSVDF